MKSPRARSGGLVGRRGPPRPAVFAIRTACRSKRSATIATRRPPCAYAVCTACFRAPSPRAVGLKGPAARQAHAVRGLPSPAGRSSTLFGDHGAEPATAQRPDAVATSHASHSPVPSTRAVNRPFRQRSVGHHVFRPRARDRAVRRRRPARFPWSLAARGDACALPAIRTGRLHRRPNTSLPPARAAKEKKRSATFAGIADFPYLPRPRGIQARTASSC